MANILDYIPKDIALLPNTSGARNADEAIRIARLSKELCGSDLVKLKLCVIVNIFYLIIMNYQATEVLAKKAYCYALYVSRFKCS